MAKKLATMTHVLRAAIAKSGISVNALSVATGVQKASIIRFMRGESSLRLDLADKLAAYLRLELCATGSRG